MWSARCEYRLFIFANKILLSHKFQETRCIIRLCARCAATMQIVTLTSIYGRVRRCTFGP
jgi:hypothetical protein